MTAQVVAERAAVPTGPVKPGHSTLHDPSGVLTRMLTSNAQWSADVARVEPTFFEQSAKGQSPKVRSRSFFFLARAVRPMGERG